MPFSFAEIKKMLEKFKAMPLALGQGADFSFPKFINSPRTGNRWRQNW